MLLDSGIASVSVSLMDRRDLSLTINVTKIQKIPIRLYQRSVSDAMKAGISTATAI